MNGSKRDQSMLSRAASRWFSKGLENDGMGDSVLGVMFDLVGGMAEEGSRPWQSRGRGRRLLVVCCLPDGNSTHTKEAQHQAHDDDETYDVNDGVHGDSTFGMTRPIVASLGPAPCQPSRRMAVGRGQVRSCEANGAIGGGSVSKPVWLTCPLDCFRLQAQSDCFPRQPDWSHRS